MNKKLIPIALCSVASSFFYAQETENTPIHSIEEVEIVSTNRISVAKKNIPQKIEVISKKDLEITTGYDIADNLKKTTSVDVIQYPHAISYISIRGFRPPSFASLLNTETSILINGRQSGTYNLATIDPNSIERIEVLKGAAAAIYGTNAMGGMVNIITRQSKGKPSGKVYLGYGSFGSYQAGFNAGGEINNYFDFDVSATYYNRSKNFKVGKNNWFRKWVGSDKTDLVLRNDINGGAVKTIDNTQFDGIERAWTKMSGFSGMARIGFKFNEDWRFDVMVDHYKSGDLESPGSWYYNKYSEGTYSDDRAISSRERTSAEFSVKGKVGKHLITGKAFYTHDNSSTFSIRNSNASDIRNIKIPTNSYTVPKRPNTDINVIWYGYQLYDEFKWNDNVRIVAGMDFSEGRTDNNYWTYKDDSYNGTTDTTLDLTVIRKKNNSPNSANSVFGPYIQGHFSLLKNKLILNPSLRYDFLKFTLLETEGFPHKTTHKNKEFFSPSMGIIIRPINFIGIHSNIGRAYRFARAAELLQHAEKLSGTKVDVVKGNPNIKNEESLTWDVGVRLNSENKMFALDVTYFNTKVKNKVVSYQTTNSDPNITWTTTTLPKNGTFVLNRYTTFKNTNETKISGLEFSGYFDFGNLFRSKNSYKLLLNGTYFIDSGNITTGTEAVDPINNVAKLNLGTGLEFNDNKNWMVRLSTRYVGHRYDSYFDSYYTGTPKASSMYVKNSKFLIADIVASYTLNKHTFSLRIDNLSDENYYEKVGFIQPGRFTSLRYTYNF